MKDTFYFSHDYNARADEKIKKLLKKHGMAGYGIFWAIVEDLYNNNNSLELDCDGIGYDLHSDPLMVRSIINEFGLFVFENGSFGSLSIEGRIQEREAKSEKARQKAYKRWRKPDTSVDPPPNSVDSPLTVSTPLDIAGKPDSIATGSDTTALDLDATALNNDATAPVLDAGKERIGKDSIDSIESKVISDAFSTDYTPINGFDSLAFKFWKQLIVIHTDLGIKPTTLQKAKPATWTNEFRLMVEKDKRTEAEINEVFDFLKTDSFWFGNIQSPEKLRKQFERLQIEIRKPKKRQQQLPQDLSTMKYHEKP